MSRLVKENAHPALAYRPRTSAPGVAWLMMPLRAVASCSLSIARRSMVASSTAISRVWVWILMRSLFYRCACPIAPFATRRVRFTYLRSIEDGRFPNGYADLALPDAPLRGRQL